MKIAIVLLLVLLLQVSSIRRSPADETQVITRNPEDGAVAIQGAHGEGLAKPLLRAHTEVATPLRDTTVMLDPFPTKQADVEKVVITWVRKTQEETFRPN